MKDDNYHKSTGYAAQKKYRQSNSYAAQRKYDKANYEEFKIRLHSGRKAQLQQLAESRGISLNRLILEALEQQYSISLDKINDDEGE